MRRFVYDGRPFALHPWGIQGALGCLYRGAPITVASVEDKEARALLSGSEPAAVLNWDPAASALAVLSRRPGIPDQPYIAMNRRTPIWQLEDGWFQLEGGYAWTRPAATARLYRPASARAFELKVNISPDMIRDVGGTRVRVFLDGRLAGTWGFTTHGWQAARWDVPPGPAGEVRVRLEAESYRPSNKDPRVLGVAVVGFGFVE